MTDETRADMRFLQRQAEGICARILDGDYPDVDIDIAIASLREEADRRFPGRSALFEMIYGSRFQRLREQFPAGLALG